MACEASSQVAKASLATSHCFMPSLALTSLAAWDASVPVGQPARCPVASRTLPTFLRVLGSLANLYRQLQFAWLLVCSDRILIVVQVRLVHTVWRRRVVQQQKDAKNKGDTASWFTVVLLLKSSSSLIPSTGVETRGQCHRSSH